MLTTKRWTQLFAAAALAVTLPAPANAQSFTTGCASPTMTDFSDWKALASGTCAAASAVQSFVDVSNSMQLVSQSSFVTLSGFFTPGYYMPGYGAPYNPWGTTCLPFYAPCTNGNTTPYLPNDNNVTNIVNNEETPNNPPPGDDTNNPPPTPPGDDLTKLVNESNSTPEPATLLLVATGLGGVRALARRRKAAQQA